MNTTTSTERQSEALRDVVAPMKSSVPAWTPYGGYRAWRDKSMSKAFAKASTFTCASTKKNKSCIFQTLRWEQSNIYSRQIKTVRFAKSLSRIKLNNDYSWKRPKTWRKKRRNHNNIHKTKWIKVKVCFSRPSRPKSWTKCMMKKLSEEI